jgi:hypothetical protein
MPVGRSGEATPHSDFAFGTLKFQRFRAIPHRLRQQGPLAVSRTRLHVSGGIGGDFIAREMLRQPFVPLLARLATAMLGNHQLQVFDGVGQAERCIGGLVRVAQVQSKLVRIIDVTLAAVAKSLLHQFVVGQFILVSLLCKLLDRLVLGLNRDVLPTKLLALRLEFNRMLLFVLIDQLE